VREAYAARAFDCVFVPREASLIGPALAERVARWRNPAFVFDFDDAVWVPYVSPTNRFFSYLKMPWKTRALCRMAAAVIAGNEYLATYARRVNSQVSIVPTTVSLRQYQPGLPRPDGATPVVGWTGSHSSAQYLKLITPAFVELRRRRDFKLVIVGAEGLSVPGVETECRPWRSETEIEDISDFDVGVMPLPDERWARGKCALKAIQYMGIGIPAIVSPVGVNAEVVSHGETGFHAVDHAEWVEALDRLLADPALRRQQGEAAYRRVRDQYSAESQAPRVAAIIREAVRRGSR
jgi:glycosyltransferase involved in cell wall biosynthesis